MGTSIKLVAYKGDDTDKEVWEKFKEDWFENIDNEAEDQNDIICSPCIYCSYSMAYAQNQIDLLSGNYEGSGIEIELTYLESDPDDSVVL